MVDNGAGAKNSSFVRIEGVSKTFAGTHAVRDVSIDIGRGELFALLGGSGCGKTTLLRMLAGFETPTSGKIYIDGKDMTGLPAYERPINMMFQSYALFPHMTVENNVAYGLKHERMTASQRMDRVREMLSLVQLSDYGQRKPHQLSGGQRQRVALARSLAKQPKVLLLDEPLGALDKKLREHTQFEIANIQDRTGITFIVVTHDQEEAMSLATRIAVMDRGEVRQIGTATEIYEFPQSSFVASFIGSINMFDGEVVALDDMVSIAVPALDTRISAAVKPRFSIGHKVKVAVRPEKIDVGHAKPSGHANAIAGRVRDLGYFGKDSLYRIVTTSGAVVSVSLVNAARAAESERIAKWDDDVWLSFVPTSVIVLED